MPFPPIMAAFLLSALFAMGFGKPTPPLPREQNAPDQARVAKIAEWLPKEPSGFGKPITDREYWTNPERKALLRLEMTKAESLLGKTFPAWNDATYLEFSKTGKRTSGDRMLRERNSWLKPLVLAECLEGKGRFLPLLREVLKDYAKQPTWVMPAHDPKLTSYRGTEYDVDLGAATFGLELAEALYLLGDKIEADLRGNLQEELRKRVFDPVIRSIRTGKGCWWLRGTNNWTAVCLAGAVGAALSTIPDPEERALFVAAGELYIGGYVNGFSPDGYCAEGVGYWNYGMRNFLLLRQELSEATAGRLDLFSQPRVVGMALFGSRILIGKTAAPCFGDCRFGTKPSDAVLAYCNEALRLKLDLPQHDGAREGLAETLMGTAVAGSLVPTATETDDPLRFYFADAGVLCSRAGGGSRLGIGIKAGGNGSHSHNDVGSYDIALDDTILTGDPGGPAWYDGKTFSSERYARKILNSYGHPVPVVDGKLQVDAVPVHAGHLKNSDIRSNGRVTETSLAGARDEMTIDFTRSYDVPSLKSLTRRMVHDRPGGGTIAIEDTVVFQGNGTFEDAVIADGEWRPLDGGSLLVGSGESRLLVHIESTEAFSLRPEIIEEMGAKPFTRIGITLGRPVRSATVKMTFSPAPQRN